MEELALNDWKGTLEKSSEMEVALIILKDYESITTRKKARDLDIGL